MTGQTIGEVNKSLDALGQKMTTIGNAMTLGVTVPLVGIGAAAVNAASDLEESMSKVNVVFDDSADTVQEWSKSAATAMGMSRQEALEAAGTYGNLFRAMGQTSEASAGMSKELVQLAADLGSFNNLKTEDVLLSLRAGLMGEAEPLRKFGVDMSAARQQAVALEMGLVKEGQALDANAKLLANYAIIMQDTGLAQGDFGRTSDGLANSMKTAQSSIKDLLADLGESLLPVATKAAKTITELAQAFNELPDSTQTAIVNIGLLVAALGPLLSVGGKVIGMSSGIASGIAKIAAAAKGALAAKAVGTAATAAASEIGTAGAAATGLEATGAAAGTGFGAAFSAAMSAVILPAAAALGAVLQKKIVEGVSKGGAGVGKQISDALGITEKLPADLQELQRLLVEEGPFSKNTWAAVVNTVQISVSDVGSALSSLGPYLRFTAQEGDYLNDFLGEVDPRMRGLAEAIGQAIAPLGNLSQTIGYLGEYLTFVVEEGDYMNDWLTWLPEGIQPVVESIGKLIAQFLDLSDLVPRALDAVKSAFSRSISSLMRDIRSWAKNIGLSFVYGIGEGINDAWNWLVERIKALALSILEAAQDTLEASSPSKLAARMVGEPIAQGIGLGIEQGMAGLNKQLGGGLVGMLGRGPGFAMAGGANYNVGHIEYHGSFSSDELAMLDRRQDRRTRGTIERVLR